MNKYAKDPLHSSYDGPYYRLSMIRRKCAVCKRRAKSVVNCGGLCRSCFEKQRVCLVMMELV